MKNKDSMAEFAYLKATIATVVCLLSLVVNVPVIVVTTCSEKLKEDIVTHVIRSLAVSDFLNSVCVSATSFVIAWLQPATTSSTISTIVVNVEGFIVGLHTTNAFLHLTVAAVVKCVVISYPLRYHTGLIDRTTAGTMAQSGSSASSSSPFRWRPE